MADRYAFTSRFGGDDPWFRVGNVDVNTTIGLIGLGVMSMIVWAVEGPGHAISKWLWFSPTDIRGGQVWRIVTWPLVNAPDFWTIILFAVLFMLGSQLEALMGRTQFLRFLLVVTIIPAAFAAVIALISTTSDITAGLRPVELGVLTAFAAHFSRERFWPGIPAPILAGVIVGISVLEYLGGRAWSSLIITLGCVAIGLLAVRAIGYAEDLDWLPKIAIPGLVASGDLSTGTRKAPRQAPQRQRRSRPRRPGRSGRGNLTAVPTPPRPTNPSPPVADAEIDALLDQISEQGIESLSKQQRAQLDEHSRRMRRRNE